MGINYSLKNSISHCFRNKYDKITDQAIETIADEITHKITGLSHLSLDFSGCYTITDRQVEYLGNQIATNLPFLSNLSLNFSGYVSF